MRIPAGLRECEARSNPQLKSLWRNVSLGVYLREQLAAAECEVFVCVERRDSEIKLAQHVLSRLHKGS